MSFNLSKVKLNVLNKRMLKLGIREQDLEEKFVLSSGKGGQKVNKASSCVYLKHIPTAIQVKCSQERSQSRNRFLARKILADKIEALIQARLAEEKARIEKIKRQKRKRSKGAKEKMLEEKKRWAQKKKVRAWRPRPDEYF